MKHNSVHIVLLVKRLFLALFIFSLCRVIFYVLNIEYFSGIENDALRKIFLAGIRFDLVAVIYINVLFIVLHSLPLAFRTHKRYQLLLKILFVTMNFLASLINIVDAKFFQFEGRRTTADIISPEWLGVDFLNLLPRFFADFWYVPLIALCILWGLWFMYPSLTKAIRGYSIRDFVVDCILFVIIVSLSVLGARGGWQLRPLAIVDAARYSNAAHTSLVLNTPFTIIHTFNNTSLPYKHYFPEEELDSIFSPISSFASPVMKKKNVVIIILESCGKEFVGSLSGYTSYTPFLDSLIQRSLVFSNAYANGRRSIDALPAIFSGIPCFMDRSFITSGFSANRISSLFDKLKKEGYVTAFFHGGRNGTMGFDNYTKLAGVEKYFGMNEYPDKAHYDGAWGIWDEEFFSFFCNELSSFSQPFCAGFFSLSAHHPYYLPEKYKKRFSDNTHPLLATIRYTDYALQKFFAAAEKTAWFSNTLFVITADHTGQAMSEKYATKYGAYAVPLVFYDPGDTLLRGVRTDIVQHCDMYPSVLDYLGFHGHIISYGKSVFDTTAFRTAIAFNDGLYHMATDSFFLYYNGHDIIELYNIVTDSLMLYNIAAEKRVQTERMLPRLQAVMQSYFVRMIRNMLTVD